MKQIVLLFSLCFLFFAAEASHIIGGNISYTCLGNGQFRFTLVTYRDCMGIAWNQNAVQLQGPVSATLSLVSAQDITARCATAGTFACDPPTTGSGTAGATAKFVFSGVVNLSSLGPTPLNGYTFWVAFPCCRPSLQNIIGGELALTVKMRRYTHPISGQILTPAQLCDNSPEFLTDPTSIGEVRFGDTLRLQNLATDPDGDVVLHAIDFPVSNFLAPYAYIPPYNWLNPLPGMVGPPAVLSENSPVHPVLGEMVMRPTTQGTFVTVVRADSYRNGQLVSQVYRDFSMKFILPPGTGTPPTIPGGPNDFLFQQFVPKIDAPSIHPDGRKAFDWDFFAEDTVSLFLGANDFFPSFTGNPTLPSTWQPYYETIRFGVQGSVLSTTNQATSGCANPPCATLTNANQPTANPALLTFGNSLFMGNGFQFGGNAGIGIKWAPGCNALPARADSVPNRVHSYGLMLRSTDTNCPVEGRSDRALVIRIHNKPVFAGPNISTLNYDSTSGTYQLAWQSVIDTVNADTIDARNWANVLSQQAILSKSVARRRSSFIAYRIYRSVNGNAWQPIGEITNPDITQFTDTLALQASHIVAYQVRVVSGCAAVETAGPTAGNEFIATSVRNHELRGITLSPNPGKGIYRLQAIEGTNIPAQLELRDMQGRIVKRIETQSTTEAYFDLTALPAGMYLLQNAEGNLRLKLVHKP